ncbi:MAG: phosphoglycerate dehydrogenase [Deltaproteobacteria bacterium]|nr:phosphoglycerate dehydrogenase [Deltaproteobacteria bacterium]
MFQVMIRDNVSPVAKEVLEATGKIKVHVDNDKASNNPEELSKIIGEYDGLIVRSGTRVNAEVLQNAGRLKAVGRAGIGVDNIDVQSATAQGVVVMNAPGGNSVTTAEHAISMMMALARNIPRATASLREGKWEKKKLIGVEVTGKTLGILGLGQIGRIVADRARGLKMKVIATDPYVHKDAADKLDVRLVPFDKLLLESDFITLHVPRMKETTNIINADTLSKTKPGVRIINCSRGEVVNLDDLYEALETGHVAGAALDVFPKEPPDPSLPILGHPKVVLSPHLGASTGEAQENVARMVAEQMAAYFIDGAITNAVNFPSVSMEEMGRLRPYLNLAEKMGSLMGQLIRAPHDITINYIGDITDVAIKPVTHALLKGFLGVFTDNPINYVNARAIARQKGIGIKETSSHEESGFSSLIKLKLEGTDEKPDEIWGTLYEKKYPRLIRIGNVYLDAIPEGHMIAIYNIDKPGVIGHIGSTLGCHNVNIGRFQLGRRDDRAVCMVNIDTPVDESVLDEIRAFAPILSVRQVNLI